MIIFSISMNENKFDLANFRTKNKLTNTPNWYLLNLFPLCFLSLFFLFVFLFLSEIQRGHKPTYLPKDTCYANFFKIQFMPIDELVSKDTLQPCKSIRFSFFIQNIKFYIYNIQRVNDAELSDINRIFVCIMEDRYKFYQ